VNAINVAKGKKVKNVFVQIHKNNSQQVDEGVTNKEGAVTFNLKEICTLIVTCKKAKYSEALARKFEITKGMLDTAVNKELILNVPMIKYKKGDDSKEEHAYAVLSFAGVPKNIKLHALSCSS